MHGHLNVKYYFLIFTNKQMAHEAVHVSKCIHILVLMLLQSLLNGFLPYRQILWNGSCLLSEG